MKEKHYIKCYHCNEVKKLKGYVVTDPKTKAFSNYELYCNDCKKKLTKDGFVFYLLISEDMYKKIIKLIKSYREAIKIALSKLIK